MVLQDPKPPGEKKKRKQQEDGSVGDRGENDRGEGQPAKKKKKAAAAPMVEGSAAQLLRKLSIAEQARLAGQLAAVGVAPVAEVPASQRSGSQPPSAKKPHKGGLLMSYGAVQAAAGWRARAGWPAGNAERVLFLPCVLAAPYEITEDVRAAIERIKAVAAQQPAPPPAPEGDDGRKTRKMLPKPVKDALADFSSLYLLQLEAHGTVSAAALATSLKRLQQTAVTRLGGVAQRESCPGPDCAGRWHAGCSPACLHVAHCSCPSLPPPFPAHTPLARAHPRSPPTTPAGRRQPHHGRAAPLAGPLLLPHQPGDLPARRQQGTLAACALASQAWPAIYARTMLATHRGFAARSISWMALAWPACLPAGAQAQGSAGAGRGAAAPAHRGAVQAAAGAAGELGRRLPGARAAPQQRLAAWRRRRGRCAGRRRSSGGPQAAAALLEDSGSGGAAAHTPLHEAAAGGERGGGALAACSVPRASCGGRCAVALTLGRALAARCSPVCRLRRWTPSRANYCSRRWPTCFRPAAWVRTPDWPPSWLALCSDTCARWSWLGITAWWPRGLRPWPLQLRLQGQPAPPQPTLHPSSPLLSSSCSAGLADVAAMYGLVERREAARAARAAGEAKLAAAAAAAQATQAAQAAPQPTAGGPAAAAAPAAGSAPAAAAPALAAAALQPAASPAAPPADPRQEAPPAPGLSPAELFASLAVAQAQEKLLSPAKTEPQGGSAAPAAGSSQPAAQPDPAGPQQVTAAADAAAQAAIAAAEAQAQSGQAAAVPAATGGPGALAVAGGQTGSQVPAVSEEECVKQAVAHGADEAAVREMLEASRNSRYALIYVKVWAAPALLPACSLGGMAGCALPYPADGWGNPWPSWRACPPPAGADAGWPRRPHHRPGGPEGS
jgi:hypothetical protein